MKFKIKYADQIVGILSGIAIVAIIFIVFLIGSKQRWFVKKHPYYTIVQSGSSISEGMSIQYKGFGIGKVKAIELNDDDNVIVHFYILDEYINRIHENSIVEISVSPIGLGSSIVFYPGISSKIIEDESFIPEKSSAEGQKLIKANKVMIGESSDSISQLLGKVQSILGLVEDILGGAPDNHIVKLLAEITETIQDIQPFLEENGQIDGMLTQIEGILANINDLTGNPQGLVPKLLETEDNKGQLSQLIGSINTTVDGLSSTVDNEMMPQVGTLLNEVEQLLRQVQDVMTGLKNNPLIKNGVPDRLEKDSATPKRREDNF